MARVKCPRCSYINADGVEVCGQCRAPLPKIKIEVQSPMGRATVQTQPRDIQLKRGQVLANRYTIIQLIGQGGMGSIYKVHDNILGEDVALKTLLPQFVQDKVVVERFFNEAKIARRLAHPNIVRVHDIGSADKLVYISMEYVQGRSLRELLETAGAGKRVPLKQTLHIFDQLCRALEYAHQFTIHRDIKPENVMLNAHDDVKLMDFGISKLMANTRLTGASMVMGTPFYMSPEQVRNSRDVDARADVYSMGIMLYEILTGNLPTGIPKPASQVMQDLPPALDEVVARAIQTNPNDRYQSAAEMREALQPLQEIVESGAELSSKPKGKIGTGGGLSTRMQAALICGGILAVTGFGIYGFEMRRREVVEAWAQQGSVAYDAAMMESAQKHRLTKDHLRRVKELLQLKPPQTDSMKVLVAQADMWVADAEQHAQTGNYLHAITFMSQALQNYLAPLMDSQGMVFIPRGSVLIEGAPVEVDPFFMDATEVTVRDFAAFVERAPEGWPLPENATAIMEADQDFPMCNVAYFDAQAYAAWRGKQLPTAAQWARAAYGAEGDTAAFPWGDQYEPGRCNDANNGGQLVKVKSFPQDDLSGYGCFDMAGNVSEWTRSIVGGAADAAAPWFGDELVVCGGNYSVAGMPMNENLSQLYQSRYAGNAGTGFRCVLEIPVDTGEVELLLRSLGSPQ
ncbi:MAG: SUMF1/EgtB/PvdO family nonheme iron enzyme [Candidatus Hydrogenedentes bacterium]|nr:SUMF1/EgtB/PvdO family nonheme iron enzyme [Candidatus Hydrogenedentota bacterium]